MNVGRFLKNKFSNLELRWPEHLPSDTWLICEKEGL